MNAEISFLESFVPTQDAFINTLILITLFIGFILIVTLNKKYKYLFDYLEKFF